MRQQTFYPSELLDFNYYVNKLPLFLQNSSGFIEHYRQWFDMLNGSTSNNFNGIIKASEAMLYLVDIFSENYITVLQEIAVSEGETYNPNKCDMLDKLANLFSINRSFAITYTDDEEVVHTNEQITLNNTELLIFIKAQLIKNFCDGSLQQIKSHYEEAGLSFAVFYNNHSLSFDLYLFSLEGSKYVYSDNIKKLFWANQLNVNLLGVECLGHEYYELNDLLIWDRDITLAYHGWDDGEWVI